MASCFGKEAGDGDFERVCNPHERIHRDGLFAALDFPDVVRMKLGFFGEFFLRQSRRLPNFSERVADDFSVFQMVCHSPKQEQPAPRSSTVYSLYFTGRFGGTRFSLGETRP